MPSGHTFARIVRCCSSPKSITKSHFSVSLGVAGNRDDLPALQTAPEAITVCAAKPCRCRVRGRTLEEWLADKPGTGSSWLFSRRRTVCLPTDATMPCRATSFASRTTDQRDCPGGQSTVSWGGRKRLRSRHRRQSLPLRWAPLCSALPARFRIRTALRSRTVSGDDSGTRSDDSADVTTARLASMLSSTTTPEGSRPCKH
jgi:hypothetical protein